LNARALLPAAVLVVFAAAGIARLNPFCLFEPDSADYLFQARALATLEGYVELDHPARPPQTFRPPGLSLLLVPAALLAPYDVVVAKLVLLGIALGTLVALLLFARRCGGPASAAASLLLVATSPYTLLHATEVLSEIPYVGAVLLVLYLLAVEENRTARPHRFGARDFVLTFALAFAPLLRTIGAALLLAVGLEGLLARSKRRLLLAAAVGAAPLAWWVARGARLGGPTYLGNVLAGLSQEGGLGFLWATSARLGRYVVSLGEVLFPGLGAGRPVYEATMLWPAPKAGLPDAILAASGLLVAALAFAAMWRRRRSEGRAALIYVVSYLGLLGIYPPEHERLVWPLVPLLWIYTAAAWTGPKRGRLRKLLSRPLGGSLLLVAAAGQGWASAGMVHGNLCWSFDGDRFYETRVPPFYFADWQEAGRWLQAKAPAHARVLTRHSDVGFTSRRFQDSLRFEEQGPADWRRAIARIRARYLVVPTTQFGKMFDFAAARGDPVYTFVPVYERRDVAILEVLPNRSGCAQNDRGREARWLEGCRRALDRMPWREDLARRLAELLVEDGRPEEAAELLRARLERGARDEVALRLSLAEALLASNEPEKAREILLRAQRLGGANEWRRSLARVLRKAEEALRARTLPPRERALFLLSLARAQMAAHRWEAAERRLAEAELLGSASAELLFLRAEVFRWTGRFEEASPLYAAAAREGLSRASRPLELLDRERLFRSGFSGEPGEWIRLADLHLEEGSPGRALAILEAARERGFHDRTIALRLADLYLEYGFPEKALPLLEALAREEPALVERARLARSLLEPAGY